ncbi:MAG: anti-sigma factor antagonist [Fretibacterium sp.]|nr:anti-sigma factor antagonist [Fretibacterium sp.]
MGRKYNLKAAVRDEQLVFTVVGRVDSLTVKEFESTVTREREAHPEGRIVFDCSGLEYISSAGLRILLSLRKKEKVPIRIVNVSPRVSEILEVTGFSQLFDVSRGMKDISDRNVRKVGGNSSLTIYRMDDDTLLKVYSNEKSLEAIEQERRYAQIAFMCGIPTIIAYDVVMYKGHYGMLYELVQVDTIASIISSSLEEREKFAADMGKLLKIVHSSEPDSGLLPETGALYEGWAKKMEAWLTPEETSALTRLIQAIPPVNTIVYGNFYGRNIFVQVAELLLINMAGISCGNPIFDLGTAYMNYVSEPEEVVKSATGLDPEEAKQFWDTMVRTYFETEDENIIQKHEEVIRAAALLRAALTPAISSPLSDGEIKRYIEIARSKVLPQVDQLAALLSTAQF